MHTIKFLLKCVIIAKQIFHNRSFNEKRYTLKNFSFLKYSKSRQVQGMNQNVKLFELYRTLKKCEIIFVPQQ